MYFADAQVMVDLTPVLPLTMDIITFYGLWTIWVYLRK